MHAGQNTLMTTTAVTVTGAGQAGSYTISRKSNRGGDNRFEPLAIGNSNMNNPLKQHASGQKD